MVADEDLRRAAEVIRTGGLVAFPTETVYGLGANALNSSAVEKIFRAKGRPPTSPLIVHVCSVEMAKSVVSEWSSRAEVLAKRFWPGPLTLVLPKNARVPDRVTASLTTVGIRIPNHPVALALIEAAGVPIAAPSANRFAGLSPTTAAHVRGSLGSAVDMVLDGGPTEIGIESTVVSLAGPPALLRPGMISQAALEQVIGKIAAAGSYEGAHPSPGMHHRHYCPRTPVVISDRPRQHSAYLWWKHTVPAERDMQMPGDPSGYAQQLYAALHVLDEEGWDCLVIEPVPDSVEWDGVRDRLRRAASEV